MICPLALHAMFQIKTLATKNRINSGQSSKVEGNKNRKTPIYCTNSLYYLDFLHKIWHKEHALKEKDSPSLVQKERKGQ